MDGGRRSPSTRVVNTYVRRLSTMASEWSVNRGNQAVTMRRLARSKRVGVARRE